MKRLNVVKIKTEALAAMHVKTYAVYIQVAAVLLFTAVDAVEAGPSTDIDGRSTARSTIRSRSRRATLEQTADAARDVEEHEGERLFLI